MLTGTLTPVFSALGGSLKYIKLTVSPSYVKHKKRVSTALADTLFVLFHSDFCSYNQTNSAADDQTHDD